MVGSRLGGPQAEGGWKGGGGGSKNYQGGRCRSRSPLTDSRASVPWSWQLFWDPCHFVNLVVLALVGPGDQTSPFCGGVGRSKLGSFALHIYVKLHSSNCSGNNAQQIVLDKIK